MNDLMTLFFLLTPTTLAAIVADLDGSDSASMMRLRQLALDEGYNNCGEDFWQILDDERDSRIQASSEPKFCDPVAAILARQS